MAIYFTYKKHFCLLLFTGAQIGAAGQSIHHARFLIGGHSLTREGKRLLWARSVIGGVAG
jgi:hypothetical protein